MQRPLLRIPELVGEQRVHRAADDRALDLGAGIDADDGAGVVDRVEVVAAARPRRGAPRRSAARPSPAARRTSVRPTAARCAGAGGRGSPASASGPPRARSASIQPRTKLDLVRSDEGGRADVEDDGPVGAQPDLGAELLAARGSAASRTSGRRTGAPGDADPIARGMPCRSTASRAWRSFQTSISSGGSGRGPCSSGCPSRRPGKPCGSRGASRPAGSRPGSIPSGSRCADEEHVRALLAEEAHHLRRRGEAALEQPAGACAARARPRAGRPATRPRRTIVAAPCARARSRSFVASRYGGSR